mmetsp:Transcript_99399/g.207062  ORF Transcript_99399/g.207062 Transcript_99399/m.207062 type:complete len:250 (+) Transcript_99399:695-1444(+)
MSVEHPQKPNARDTNDGDHLAAFAIQQKLLGGLVLVDESEGPIGGLQIVLGADDDVVVGILRVPVGASRIEETIPSDSVRRVWTGPAAVRGASLSPAGEDAAAASDCSTEGVGALGEPMLLTLRKASGFFVRNAFVFDPVQEADQSDPGNDGGPQAEGPSMVHRSMDEAVHCWHGRGVAVVPVFPLVLGEVPADDGEGDQELAAGGDELHQPDSSEEVEYDPGDDACVEVVHGSGILVADTIDHQPLIV